MPSIYDSEYKARIRDAVLKAIVRESLQPTQGGGRTARVQLAEAFDGAVEALTMLSNRADRLRLAEGEEAADDSMRLSRLVNAAHTLRSCEPRGSRPTPDLDEARSFSPQTRDVRQGYSRIA